MADEQQLAGRIRLGRGGGGHRGRMQGSQSAQRRVNGDHPLPARRPDHMEGRQAARGGKHGGRKCSGGTLACCVVGPAPLQSWVLLSGVCGGEHGEVGSSGTLMWSQLTSWFDDDRYLYALREDLDTARWTMVKLDARGGIGELIPLPPASSAAQPAPVQIHVSRAATDRGGRCPCALRHIHPGAPADDQSLLRPRHLRRSGGPTARQQRPSDNGRKSALQAEHSHCGWHQGAGRTSRTRGQVRLAQLVGAGRLDHGPVRRLTCASNCATRACNCPMRTCWSRMISMSSSLDSCSSCSRVMAAAPGPMAAAIGSAIQERRCHRRFRSFLDNLPGGVQYAWRSALGLLLFTPSGGQVKQQPVFGPYGSEKRCWRDAEMDCRELYRRDSGGRAHTERLPVLARYRHGGQRSDGRSRALRGGSLRGADRSSVR